MAVFSPIYVSARKEIWGLIEDCKGCERRECPEWCREFVACQMDDLIERLIRAEANQSPCG